MADLNSEGIAPANPVKQNEDKGNKAQTIDKKHAGEHVQNATDTFKVEPTQHVQGNELVAICRLLAGINKNLAFLATTVYKHLNPEGKDGRPSK